MLVVTQLKDFTTAKQILILNLKRKKKEKKIALDVAPAHSVSKLY